MLVTYGRSWVKLRTFFICIILSLFLGILAGFLFLLFLTGGVG
jgi:hypothetical protein